MSSKAAGLADFTRTPEPADTTPGARLTDAELRRYAGTFASTSPCHSAPRSNWWAARSS